MGRGRPHHGGRRRGRSGGPRRRSRTLTGTLVVSSPGAAHVETAEGEFELVRHGQREAMNGDKVEVALVEQRGRAPRAVVRSVLQRAVTTLLGTFSQAGPLGVVTPLDVRLGHDFFVVPEDPCAERLGLGEGDVVLARIIILPFNAWIGSISPDFPDSFAVLDPVHAVILVALSIGLTVLSGLIPAMLAARKDPVKALRASG